MALTTRTSRSWMSRMTWVPLWVRPTPMWRSFPATRRVTVPTLSMRSKRTRSWVSLGAEGLGWPSGGGVGGGRGRSVRLAPHHLAYWQDRTPTIPTPHNASNNGRLDTGPLMPAGTPRCGLLRAGEHDVGREGQWARGGAIVFSVRRASCDHGTCPVSRRPSAGGGVSWGTKRPRRPLTDDGTGTSCTGVRRSSPDQATVQFETAPVSRGCR